MKYFFVLFLLCFGYSTYAQHAGKNNLSVEVLGAGGWWAANYERKVFTKKLAALHVRAGLGTYRFRDYELKLNPDITIPVAAHFLYGKKHKLDLSIGQTLSNIVQLQSSTMEKKRIISLSAFAGVGYRYQSTKGLMLRISYIPMIEYYQHFRHWAGVSVGYTF